MICPICCKARPSEAFLSKTGLRRVKVCLLCRTSRIRQYTNKKKGSSRKNARKVPITSYRRNRNYQKNYGISYGEFLQLVEAQEGKCLICELPPSDKLHVDHCHDTLIVRGLLCKNCNVGLGFFGDSIERLEAAVKYLRRQ